MAEFGHDLEISTNIMPMEKDGKPSKDVNVIMAYLLANSVIKLITINHNTETNYTIEYPTWINNYKQSTIDQLKKIIKNQLDIYFNEETPTEFIKKMLDSKESFIESVYDREKMLKEQLKKDKYLLINRVIKEMKVTKLKNTVNDCKFTIDFPTWLYSGEYNTSLVKEITDMLTHQSIKGLSEITRLNYKSHSSNIDSVLT